VTAVPARKGGWWVAVTAARVRTSYHRKVTSVAIIKPFVPFKSDTLEPTTEPTQCKKGHQGSGPREEKE
jgi:hypothetical protein